MDQFIVLNRQELYDTLRIRFGTASADAAMNDIERVERTDMCAVLRINTPRPKEANECGCQG